MPKILHIIDSGGLYGAEVMLLNLVAEQKRQGLAPTIISIGEKGIGEKPLETEAIKRGFQLKKIRMLSGPNIAGALHILRFAKDKNFSLIHSHGYKGNILLGFIPKKIRKIPIITTLHGYTSTAKFTKMKIYEWLDQKCLNFLDAVVLVSNAMKTHPKLKTIKNKCVHVVLNGIPVPGNKGTQFNKLAYRNLDKKILNFCSEGFVIGSIGRLSDEKGYNYIIEAVSLLEKRGINTRLLLFGEGNQREPLENLINKHKLEGKILFAGYKKNARDYIPLFDVYTISSLTEGLPITLLEAMQARTPIIATKVGGIPEVLSSGPAGILIDAGSSEAIVQAVIKLYESSELKCQLIENAFSRLKKDFTSKRMVDRYLEIYKEVLSCN